MLASPEAQTQIEILSHNQNPLSLKYLFQCSSYFLNFLFQCSSLTSILKNTLIFTQLLRELLLSLLSLESDLLNQIVFNVIYNEFVEKSAE